MPGDLRALEQLIDEVGNAPTQAAALELLLKTAAQFTRSPRGLLRLRDVSPTSLPAARLGLDDLSFPAAAPASIRQAVETALHGGAPSAFPPQPGEGGWGAALCLPLLCKGYSHGVLYLERPAQDGAYTEAEQQIAALFAAAIAAAIAAAFAAHAALILENQRLEDALRQASEAQTRYISTLTHELRVPMTSIRGYADLLSQGLAGPLNAQQIHFANVIRSNVERMSTLVAHISDISRLDAGQLKLNVAAVALRVSLEEAVQGVAALLQEKSHALERDLPAVLPPARADPLRLTQVLATLLDNACRYAPHDSRIRVSAWQEDCTLFVSVKDNGIGVSPEERPRLFQAFFRSEDERVRAYPGWGLGLHVARRLVEAMGGEMGARFDDPPGSEFCFSLPVYSVEQEDSHA